MRRRFHMLVSVCAVLGTSSAWAVQVADEVSRRDAIVHYRLGQELMHAEQFDRATLEFSTAIKLDPLLTLAHYQLGQAHMALKRYPDAVRAYIGCREAFHKLAGLIMSHDAEADRRRSEEIDELRNSIGRFRSGQIKTVRSREGIIAELEQRINDLERMKQRGATHFDTPAEVSMALGSAYYRSGALADAEREYLAAIKVNDKFGEAHNNLAVIYMQTGRLDAAELEVKLAEKAGFRVNPQFKEDLKKQKAAARQTQSR